MKYVRADKVLPQKLLAKVRQHCTGMIYVPSDGAFYRERNAEVMRLHGQGLPTAEIARRVFLGPRRVRQIIKSETDIPKHTSPPQRRSNVAKRRTCRIRNALKELA